MEAELGFALLREPETPRHLRSAELWGKQPHVGSKTANVLVDLARRRAEEKAWLLVFNVM